MAAPKTSPVTASFDPGVEKGRLVLTRRYHQPPGKVWAAVATPERIADWMGVEWRGDAELRKGAAFSYLMGGSDMESIGHVTAFDPPRLLEHTWFANLGRPAVIRWEVAADGDGALLTLTQTAYFPDDATRNGAGWTMLLAALARSLGEEEAPPEGGWRGVQARLAAELPPEAVRDGWIESGGDRPVVRFDRKLRQPIERVWAALTTPERLVEWIGRVDVEPRVGGRFDIDFQQGSSMRGTITAFEPPRLLELVWREPWLETDSARLRFALAPDPDGGTRLALSHSFQSGYDPFDYLAGWHQFMDTLEAALDGAAIDWRSESETARYKIVERIYRAVASARAA